MNIKCNCGRVYSIPVPRLEADLDVNIYTDGVVEGGSVPRDIKVFRCSECGEYRYLAQCEKTTETGDTLTEPESHEYLDLIQMPDFDSLGIRIKAWQRSNDRYRNIDSLEDVGVKIELLRAKISETPSVVHFDEYIEKMNKKYEESPSEIILKKIEELKEKKNEVVERLAEKNHLKNLEETQTLMAKTGETTVEYTPEERANMDFLLKNLEDSSSGLLIKSEIYRNLGRFQESVDTASAIHEAHYEKIVSLILDLSGKKLKKVTLLRD